MVSFPPVSPARPYTPPSPHPYAPHAQPISLFSILSPAQFWVRSTNHLYELLFLSAVCLVSVLTNSNNAARLCEPVSYSSSYWYSSFADCRFFNGRLHSNLIKHTSGKQSCFWLHIPILNSLFVLCKSRQQNFHNRPENFIRSSRDDIHVRSFKYISISEAYLVFIIRALIWLYVQRGRGVSS